MRSGVALALYTALSLVLTWPLVLGLGSDVPGDLGDSLLNMWILAWGAEHLPGLVTGSVSWTQYWNANIFHPEPLALALSEHLFGQTLQILPIYWLTGNIILCYNLLFIATFALSAFGTFLLVRDLTGSARAAFVAGLVYGFLPYRIASVPHLQVMSSQWMPFALYGLNRFVTTGSHRALAGGTAALVLQNWSCGYYLLYFAPFVPLFVVGRMWIVGTLRRARVWIGLATAAGATLLLTLPFLMPYRQVQAQFGIERPYAEIVQFSANVWSYVTASESVRLWGSALRFYPHGEGETFLGFMPWLLALAAGVAVVRQAVGHTPTTPLSAGRRIATGVLLVAVATQVMALFSVVLFGGFDVTVLGLPIRARTPSRLLMQFAVSLALLLAVSPRVRAVGARLLREPVLFFALATLFAMWLSLGPVPKAGEALVPGFGIYGMLYDYVPGFNGVRVPARYAMIAGLFLSVLGGLGAAVVLSGAKAVSPKPEEVDGRRRTTALILGMSVLILLEGAAAPLALNYNWSQGEAMPPPRVYPATREAVPPVYTRVRALPEGSVVTEFPFGDAAWEIRYVYYSAAHWKPITNGYSGGFPPRYKERVARLQRLAVDPDGAWQSLLDSGTTHVIVHRAAFANPAHADAVAAWLTSRGAVELERFVDGDILWVVRR